MIAGKTLISALCMCMYVCMFSEAVKWHKYPQFPTLPWSSLIFTASQLFGGRGGESIIVAHSEPKIEEEAIVLIVLHNYHHTSKQ